ncbi:MAG: YegS/Rv2252/BmrU family lipid kinase [Alphaproteobacteria bacterium]
MIRKSALSAGAKSEPVAMDPRRPPAGRSILVIYNPVAGARSRRRYRAVLAALEARGCRVTVRETRRRGHAEAIAADARAEDFDVLAVAGGDGTVNEAVNGLGPASPPLGVIPLGTANSLAFEIGLGLASARIARTLAECPPVPVPVGQVDGRRFILFAGVGLDAHAVAGLSPGLKSWAGKGAYYWQIVVELARYRLPELTVTADGEVFHAASVVVANGRSYGGRFVLAPGARLDEAGFEVCLFSKGGRWNALRYLAALGLGRLSRLDDVKFVKRRRVVVEGPAGEPVQGDGELIAELPATIEVAPEPVAILAPALARGACRG